MKISNGEKWKYVLLKLTGPALDWWLDLQSLRDQQNKRHICAWSRIKKCLMERFLPHNYKQLLDEKYGSNQQNTTTLAKDVIEEIDKVVIEGVVDKKIETEVGDQVVEGQNSYPLEMVDTKICVKEEPSLLQVDHVDLDNWVLLTRDDFTENIPSNIREKEDGGKEEMFVDSPAELILSVANWEAITCEIEESSKEKDDRRDAGAHESTNGHHLKALIGQHSSFEGNISGLVNGPHEEKLEFLYDVQFIDFLGLEQFEFLLNSRTVDIVHQLKCAKTTPWRVYFFLNFFWKTSERLKYSKYLFLWNGRWQVSNENSRASSFVV
ncbi:hypothetical protein RHGRI_035662 [Rhododendron griersonianum]|uniref:Retrotransposon gag domain-containing protein n=1 Tax=Rhododendron griersonianum TaxID=479676 RepID=A0AAV6HKD2_9ERIC|nr:hypothetical protein RHGRI_035662 [Rhododendron griersonianum]